jgi:mRNA interferase RelE/StbE
MADEYAVKYPEPAVEQLQQLDHDKGAVKSKIDELKSSEPSKLGKPLSGELSGLRSVRAAGHRIVYGVFEEEKEILIYGVGRRREGERSDIYATIGRLYDFVEE